MNSFGDIIRSTTIGSWVTVYGRKYHVRLISDDLGYGSKLGGRIQAQLGSDQPNYSAYEFTFVVRQINQQE